MAGPWYYRSGATGTGDGLSWTNARTTLATQTSVVAGDTLYVAYDHNETTSGALTITLPGTNQLPNLLLSVDNSTGALRTGAQITNTGNAAMTINGSFYAYGFTLWAGSGSSSNGNLALCAGSNNVQTWERCFFNLLGSVNSIQPLRNFVSNASVMEWIDCTANFSATNQGFTVNNGDWYWHNGPGYAALTGTIPNTLFSGGTGAIATVVLEGLDLTALSTGKTLIGSGLTPSTKFYFNGCRIGTPTITGAISTLWTTTYFNFTDAGGNSVHQDIYNQQGTLISETQVVRADGANTGDTAFSWRLNSSAAALWVRPQTTPQIAFWNTAVAADVPIVVRGMLSGYPNVYDTQVWLLVSYQGNAGNTMAVVKSTRAASVLGSGTNLPADTSDWTTNVPLRANSTAYVVGAPVKVASNPTRVFTCISAGTTASSEPAAYATSVDGSASFNDGTALFRACLRFQLSTTLTSPQPQYAGMVYITVCFAVANGLCWIDPEVNSS